MKDGCIQKLWNEPHAARCTHTFLHTVPTGYPVMPAGMPTNDELNISTGTGTRYPDDELYLSKYVL